MPLTALEPGGQICVPSSQATGGPESFIVFFGDAVRIHRPMLPFGQRAASCLLAKQQNLPTTLKRPVQNSCPFGDFLAGPRRMFVNREKATLTTTAGEFEMLSFGKYLGFVQVAFLFRKEFKKYF